MDTVLGPNTRTLEPHPQWIERQRAIQNVARSAKCDFALRYFDIAQAADVIDACWQPFQIDVLNSTETFASYNKSRQIGMSFILSADALFDSIINGLTFVMVSFNLEEATEKIRYAKKWWESRNPTPWLVPARGEYDERGNWLGVSPNRISDWPELERGGSFSMYFSNGARLISHPCRPPRGKKASVILDEYAHYQQDGPIFTAALPMITRGQGRNRIIMASTPLGASGKFWEIHTDREKYPDFHRGDYGWWEIQELCKPENRVACIKHWILGAGQRELVRKYGTSQLKMIFKNVLFDEFMQEYGLSFLDSSHSFLSWATIRSCYPVFWDGDEDEESDYDKLMTQLDSEFVDNISYIALKCRCEPDKNGVIVVDNAIKCINSLASAVEKGFIRGALIWSFDCGRDADPAEITVWEIDGGQYKQRLIITMPQTSFDNQEAVINQLMIRLPIVRGMMDKGGNGRQLAERMCNKWGEDRCMGVWFDAPRKETWALCLKRNMERRKVTLIPDRDQEQQLHSIQRKSSTAKNMIYIMEESTSTVGGGRKIKHHADKFWVCAMACYICEVLETNSQGFSVEVDEPKATVEAHRQVQAKGFGSVRLASREAVALANSKMSGSLGRGA